MAILDNYLHRKYQKKPAQIKPNPSPKQDDTYEKMKASLDYLMGSDGTITSVTTTSEPTVQHETSNSEVSSLITNLSQKALLDLLKNQWKHLNSATIIHILEIIGYPQPFPDIDNITNITYIDNILEIIEGEKPNEVDEYNVPGHRVHKSRYKESDPVEYPIKKRSRGYGDIPEHKPRDWNFTSTQDKINSGPQSENRPVDII